MKSQNLLTIQVLEHFGTWCCTDTLRDRKTIMKRYEDEGLSFVTITLPNFCDDFQKSLDQKFVSPSFFAGFAKNGELPRFLGGFLDLIFIRDSGCLLENPSIDAIFAIRQICLLYKKIELPCTQERVDKAIEKYLQCELEVKEAESRFTSSPFMMEEFCRIATLLFGDVLTEMDSKVYYGDLVPKHGPGATADKLRGNAKYEQTKWPTRLDTVFPYGEYCLPNWRYNYMLDFVDFHEPGAEIPVKVITVPKTMKTPRIIAVEPTAMQYIQQALMIPLVKLLESNDMTRGFIGFLDQDLNKAMAQEGSITGALATLDLSEASDRVSNQLVRQLLSISPNFAEGVDACRSRKADVPGHGVIRLAKFASMGSALCFPIEAMVFLTIIFLGIQDELKQPLTRKSIKGFKDQVRVYGDDIIVPVGFVHPIITRLEDFGLRVNRDKSFWTGKFRESCGGEYYDGTDVTPVRIKTEFPTGKECVNELVSTVALRNRFYKKGLWNVVSYLDNRLLGIIPFPVVEETSSVLGRYSFLGYETQRTEGPNTMMRPLVKGYTIRTKPPISLIRDEFALLKCLLRGSQPDSRDCDHLERTGRPEAVGIKLRWAPPY